MVNYWAIQIGINQYRFLPPLSYAQRDAEQWLAALNQAGIPSQHCCLLTDPVTRTIPVTGTIGEPRLPTVQNIQAQLAYYQQMMQPQDMLLFFFSGYGLYHQGKDYLLPIEGDPRQVVATGIGIEPLFQLLNASGIRSLVLLDANRSQLGLERGGFGEETLKLAQQYGIAVLLSCQPQQFSHEPLTLRQGLFTTALVEAIQTAGCATVEQLVQFVADRLPRLSEECWRPRQDVLAFVPPHLRYQMLLPWIHRSQPIYGVAGKARSHLADSLSSNLTDNFAGVISPFSFLSQARLSQASAQLTQRIGCWFRGWMKPQSALSLPAPAPASATLAANWQAANLNPALRLPDRSIGSSEAESQGTEAGAEALPKLSDDFTGRRLLFQGGLIAAILLFGVILRNSGAWLQSTGTPSDPLAPTAALSPPAPRPASTAPETLVPVDPELQFKLALDAFQSQQFEEANRRLGQIPIADRTAEQNQLLQQSNQALLDEAKTMLIRIRQPRAENQVSDFVEAIRIARLIKPDQPLYSQAQQDIDRWSRVILDMAQGRAARPDSDSALDIANNYKTAISAARLVPSDQPIYPDATTVISGWSQRILDLATEQAQQGDLDRAIQIGELVPPYTEVYALAQEAIAGWRNQPLPEETARSVGSKPTLDKAAEPGTLEPTSTIVELTQPALTQSGSSEPEPEPEPEPVAVEPVDPTSFEPEYFEPESAEPELTEPEYFEPELAEPALTEPEFIEPASGEAIDW
ncbi:MAG: caspase family protein [Elainella sp. Prado103]|nr:caspase family protein [Elainella sp. Prado103]